MTTAAVRPQSVSRVPFSTDETCTNPLWDERKDLSALLTPLREGQLIYSCPMREFLEKRNKIARYNNEVHYGILQHGNIRVAVVYKPKEEDHLSAAYAESLAYEVYEKWIAVYTGNHLIPPTVVRTMPDGRVASCQFFVETEDTEDMWNLLFREEIFKDASSEVMTEMAVYNSVFNNWDRHPGNYLATRREGRIHLASIDNESIENKGWLEKWGERSYVPIAFTEDAAAQIEKNLEIRETMTLEEFKGLLLEQGFKDVPRVDFHYNNLMNRGKNDHGSPLLKIKDNCLAIRFHQGNPSAFPLPRGPYSQTLLDAYRHLDRTGLEEDFQSLTALDPKRFQSRASDILTRRDLFLESAAFRS